VGERLQRSEVLGQGREELLDVTIGGLLRRVAAEVPDRTALVEVAPDGPSLVGAESNDRTWTYAELLAAAERAAAWLLEQVEPGDRVTIWAPNVPEWVVLQYGAALAGVILVTANPALTTGELAYVLAKSRSRGLVHPHDYLGRDTADIAREAAAEAGGVELLADLRDWPAGAGAGGGGAGTLPEVAATDPAMVQFTSGTTGFPKGALLAHLGLVNNPRFINRRAGIGDGGVLVSPMPLFHTGGCVIATLGALHARATYVLCQRYDPELQLGAIDRWQATLTSGVPTMLIGLLAHPRLASTDTSALEVVISGGSSVPPDLVRRVQEVFGAELITVYGQTELSPVVCQTSPDDSPEDKAHTVGLPLPEVDVRVVSATDGSVTGIGVDGELCARGYQQMIGYFDDEAATAATVDGDGWVHTGDLAAMDERGYVRITGRLRDMIIRGGENIYPAEIEHVLFEHPGVAEAAVVGVPDERWGEQVAAVLRLADTSAPPSPAELTEWCRRRLAAHKAPRSWHTTDALPLTGSGKVQKFVIREQLAAGELPALG
jgi:fatty-acyl-CoA synthase